MKTEAYHPRPQPPAFRRLRVFALDPSLAVQVDTAGINELVLEVPWEVDRHSGLPLLERGPIGEYVEVIDYDPASGMYYAPVDLNDPYLLAQDGLTPAEGNPQFHQQMVYAVVMTTIGHFERALGRVVLWSPRIVRDAKERLQGVEFVRRLRIYPHALRDANAYYSWRKKALLFGYFTVSDSDGPTPPGGKVFTCLSHDIIAHETAHALLDGIHPRFMEPTNEDVLALHEAFADIVAIFQRFANPAVLRHQIARTRGDLGAENLMSKLALQFGQAIGHSGALRDALGQEDKDGQWQPAEIKPGALAQTTTPHERGAILVAAVFDAFLLIYRSRVADLVRIATQGAGILAGGALHPDLVQRLANEAAKAAQHILQMCIRALDYCPPIDVTFGDYLRAIITADCDLYPEDRYSYRVAVTDAFRRRGIYPKGTGSLCQDSLCWPTGLESLLDLRRTAPAGKGRRPPASMARLNLPLHVDWDLQSDRLEVWDKMRKNAEAMRGWLLGEKGRKYVNAFGLTLDPQAPPSVSRDKKTGLPEVEVFVRTALRRGYRDSLTTDLVVEMTQWRHGFYEPKVQDGVDTGRRRLKPRARPDFKFRRGCTVLISPSDMCVRYVMRTAGTVADDQELKRVREFLTRENPAPGNAFTAGPCEFWPDEDILQLHRAAEGGTSDA